MEEIFQDYLSSTDIINFTDPKVAKLAKSLAHGLNNDIDIAKTCFLYVRDQIDHSGDIQSKQPTCKASDVLEHQTGWCYAKSHLLAALLRANNIPTGFCYQRLFCDEYKKDSYCLHGLNAIYLQDHGWYRVDARGNKEGVNAQFDPPHEILAFNLLEGEEDLDDIYTHPLDVVISSLSQDYDRMINNFPDIQCC